MARVFSLLSLLLGLAWAQCPRPVPPPPTCDGCLPLNEKNPIVPNGQTRCVPAGVTMTISSLDLRKDAVLIVCGTLIVDGNLNLNNNGSQIIVTPGASVQVSSNANINSQASIHNYGIMNIQNNLTLNGAGSLFWNIGPSGSLTVGGEIRLNASANFINDGTNIQAYSLTLNGNATVCMASGACFSLNNLTANGSASVIVGNGPAAISYTGHATLNGGQLTSTDDLYVCQAPGATVNNPSNWGTQNVVTNCTSGCSVLPHQTLTVSGRVEGAYIHVQWVCRNCPAEVTYEVSVLTKHGKSQLLGLTGGNQWMIAVGDLPATEGYIQVVALDQMGRSLLRGMMPYEVRTTDKLIVYPTIVEREVQVWYANGAVEVELYDSYGRLVRRGEGNRTWDISDLPSGVYVMVGRVEGRTLPPVRLIRP
ncbi:MAG: hypothetical protein RQ993_01670 [Bacteroidota bacterium]|nr:hypothetical protein [Bacteroidota bacterium]